MNLPPPSQVRDTTQGANSPGSQPAISPPGWPSPVRLRRLLEEAQQRMAEQSALLDQTSDAIIVWDLEHRIRYWNRSASRIFGWSADEALGRSVRELLSGDPALFDLAMAALLQNGEWRGELERKTRHHDWLALEGHWTLARDAAGRPQSVLAVLADITGRKQMETQFLRAQRVASIATLAGGIAHDLNNTLAPVMMAIELLKTKFPQAENGKLLGTIQASTQRGADLVGQLLSLARGLEGKHVSVNLRHLSADLQKVVQESFPKTITFDLVASRDLWLVNADPTQIHQVLLNLCVNARDAMPKGGCLTVSFENCVHDELQASLNPGAKPGAYVLIKVTDTGAGIPADLRSRVFEPSFTTQEAGQGAGLGLSTTLSIVKSHGGFMQLHSEAGRGTSFEVYLPADPAVNVPEHPAAIQAVLPRGQGELVLVVDDEESIRAIAQKTCERFGYRVLLASQGAEAVSIYAQQANEISVVLTDMAMPIMDGPALVVALKTMNPAVKIIGSSGLTSNRGMELAIGQGVDRFIPKPYSTETLLQNLHGVLHEGKTPAAVGVGVGVQTSACAPVVPSGNSSSSASALASICCPAALPAHQPSSDRGMPASSGAV